MEIIKIFSNVEDESENLYSVLMSEDEIYLFSELQKEFNSKSQKAFRSKVDRSLSGPISKEEINERIKRNKNLNKLTDSTRYSTDPKKVREQLEKYSGRFNRTLHERIDPLERKSNLSREALNMDRQIKSAQYKRDKTLFESIFGTGTTQRKDAVTAEQEAAAKKAAREAKIQEAASARHSNLSRRDAIKKAAKMRKLKNIAKSPATKIAAGTALVAGGAYGVRKVYKKKKSEED